jgi:prepilin-type N-terminal cleavage/methylation domain-containing protein
MSTRSGLSLLEVLVALTIVVTAWARIAAALPRLIGPSPAERAALAVEGMLRQAREASH